MKKNKTGLLLTILSILVIFCYVFPFIAFFLGQKAYVKQDYVKAFGLLNFAYHMHKNNENYRYYYAQTLTKLKPILKVQKDLFEIAESNLNDGAKRVASKKIEDWKLNIEYNIGSNYIYNAPSEKGIIRWDTSKFPLKITISGLEGIPSYYRTEILAAFKNWEDSIDFLEFTYVENTKDANILVKISPLPQDVCNGKECQYIVGYTVPTIKNGLLKKMTITLYDKNATGEFFSDKEIFNTTLHELGHALGIMGHSYYEGDLMFVTSTSNRNLDFSRIRSAFQFLTSRDINTMKLLYKLIPSVTNTSIKDFNTDNLIYAPIVIGTSKELNKRKVQEAMAYIAQAPELSSGYIDLAIAYSELGENEKAVEQFKKAIKLAQSDAELYLAYYNLAVQYQSTHKKAKALKYAKLAQKINNTDEVIELISKIKR